MGLGEMGLMEDGGGGECKTTSAAPSASCSVCCEAVTDLGDRSWAKLRCGHQFHLDCIGSAFNAKGAMQCPNCRNVEKGQWLYSNGSGSVSDFSMEDWVHVHDDDLFDYYSEMSFGVHWCPFSGLARLPPSADQGEFSSIASHAPYVAAYLGPIHASSVSSGTASEGSSFNTYWSVPSVPSEAPMISYAYNSMGASYCRWEPSPHRANPQFPGADPLSMASVAGRTAPRNSSGVHPFAMGHSSSGRAPSSVPSPAVPRFAANATRLQGPAPAPAAALQGHFQPSSHNPATGPSTLPPGRIRSNRRVTRAHTEPATSSSDQTGGYYFFSPSSAFQEVENHHRNPSHGWGQNSIPLNLVDIDLIRAPFHPPVAAASDTGFRSNSARRRRHGSDRMVPSHYHHS